MNVVLVFLFLTLTDFIQCYGVSIADFEQVIASWENVMINLIQKLKKKFEYWESSVTQTAFTCSKLTRETLEQGVKYVQS